MNTFDYGTERWDLVAAIYIHGLLTVKPEAVVRSLKPGGILVFEGFHRDALPDAGYRTNELLTIFGGLTVLWQLLQPQVTAGECVNKGSGRTGIASEGPDKALLRVILRGLLPGF